jgi:hypothetical protein
VARNRFRIATLQTEPPHGGNTVDTTPLKAAFIFFALAVGTTEWLNTHPVFADAFDTLSISTAGLGT